MDVISCFKLLGAGPMEEKVTKSIPFISISRIFVHYPYEIEF